MTSLSLQQSQYYELKQLDIGPRIRYIRELLNNHYGSKFSARVVAERIKVISYPALASIERGDTKDPTARVMNAIAKDFGININVFFDDYYMNEYVPIDISYHYSERENESKHTDLTIQDSNGNRMVVEIYEVSERMDRRNLVSIWSKQKIDKSHTIQLISTIHQHIETLDKMLGEDSPTSEAEKSSYFWATEHYEKRTHASFPWIPEGIWTLKRNEMFDIGREHTKQVLEKN